MSRPITSARALAIVLGATGRLRPRRVPLARALGRVLAENVRADGDNPPWDNSAMDGYGVRHQDLKNAGEVRPVRLNLIGTVMAGQTTGRAIGPGQAMGIMTGAPVPRGVTAVIPVEFTREERGRVLAFKTVAAGENIRRRGENIRRREKVLSPGSRIGPSEVGMLAIVGRNRVKVTPVPKVAVLATGDELVDVDEPITPGKIRNSNEYTSIALVKLYGGEPVALGIARDTAEDLTAKIQGGVEQNVDLFLTSAGVSVGDFDIVKNVLAAEGEMHFWQVAIKPGKPLAFGIVGGVPLLGLPGNPVAAMVAFEVFARPAILKLGGHASWNKPSVRAILDEDVHNSGRRHFMRARVRQEAGDYRVTTRGSGVQVQGSGILSSLVWANGLVVVPEEVTFIEAGSSVEVWMLDWPRADPQFP